MSRKNIYVGLFYFAIILSIFSQFISAYPPNLVCPPHGAYPKDIFDNVLSGPEAFDGTTRISGSVLFDVSGKFDFVKIANISGTFLQWYSKEKGTIVFDMYIDIGGGVQVSVLNSTFTLLTGDKYSGYGQFCMSADPVDVMPGYVEGMNINNKFFYSTHFNSPLNGTFDGKFGGVNQSEYFYISKDRKHAVNCLTAFNINATIKSLTCYNFDKISDKIIYPSPPCSKRNNIRTLDSFSKIVKLGKISVPIDVVYPEYRYLF
ncbi:putative membrane protein [Moumouvirus maliensis]|nr:putative membrane protein [Moumouvirus maliensis]